MMLTSFFILCDQSERAAPELMSKPILGGFIKGGVCATIAWGVAWVCASSASLTLRYITLPYFTFDADVCVSLDAYFF